MSIHHPPPFHQHHFHSNSTQQSAIPLPSPSSNTSTPLLISLESLTPAHEHSYFVAAEKDTQGPIEDPFAIQSDHQYTKQGVTGLILSNPGSLPTSASCSDESPSTPGPHGTPHDPIFFDSRASGFWNGPPPPPAPHFHFPGLPPHQGLGLFLPSFGPCEPELNASFGPSFTPRLAPFPPFPPTPPHMQMHHPFFPPGPSFHPMHMSMPPMQMPPPPPSPSHFPLPAPPHMQNRRYSFFSAPSAPLTSPAPSRRGSLQTPRFQHLPSNSKPRSDFLEAFCTGLIAVETIQEIKGYIVEFACDQVGSRFLQVKMEYATHDDKQLAFDEIMLQAYQLMTDVFGNYVVQRMFEYGSQAQKADLARSMYGHVLGLSMHVYGCRVVQKALEHVLADQQVTIISELEGHIVECVQSSHGNHVIQRMLEQINPTRLGFVVEALSEQMYELSTHPYGCRVLQRAFEHLKSEQTTRMVVELNKRASELILDPFGNYVVQNLIKCGAVEDKRFVIRSLLGQLRTMARHKYGSNVCEQAVLFAEPEDRRALIQEMLDLGADGVSAVQLYMNDSYANYVLQKAIRVADEDQKRQLLLLMRPVLTDMRKARYSTIRHLASIEKLVTDMSEVDLTNSQRQATVTIEDGDSPRQPISGKLIELELESPLSASEAFTESDDSDDGGWSV